MSCADSTTVRLSGDSLPSLARGALDLARGALAAARRAWRRASFEEDARYRRTILKEVCLTPDLDELAVATSRYLPGFSDLPRRGR